MNYTEFFKDPFLEEHINPLTLSLLRRLSETGSTAHMVEFVLRRLFQGLYLKHRAHVTGEAFFLSTVHSDGVGDYYALLKSVKAFRKHYPEADAIAVYTHKQKLPPVNAADYLIKPNQIEPFLETSRPETHILEPILEGKTAPLLEEKLLKLQQEKRDYEDILAISDSSSIRDFVKELDREIAVLHNEKRAFQLYERMKKSLAVVNIALAFNTFDNPMLAPKSFYFAEAGNFQGLPALLKLNWFSMGVQAFDEGIFLKSTDIPSEWKDSALPHFLWESSKPTHKLYLGYLPRLNQELEAFIKCICLREQKNSQQVDIVLPFAECEINLSREWLKKCGFAHLERINWSAEEVKQSSQDYASDGKLLRLIFTPPLHEHDFVLLMHLADDFVGCTGDGSISECLTLGKIPFYATRKHKIQAIQAFQELAVFLKLSLIESYFSVVAKMREDSAENTAESLFRLVENPLFNAEWERYLDFIRRYYCLEDAMMAHLNRHFLLSQNHSLKEQEEALVKEVLSGGLSAQESYQRMSALTE